MCICLLTVTECNYMCHRHTIKQGLFLLAASTHSPHRSMQPSAKECVFSRKSSVSMPEAGQGGEGGQEGPVLGPRRVNALAIVQHQRVQRAQACVMHTTRHHFSHLQGCGVCTSICSAPRNMDCQVRCIPELRDTGTHLQTF